MAVSMLYALVVVSVWGWCGAKPYIKDRPLMVDIRSAVNRTVCPFEMSVDYDPDRIPKRIMEVKCLVSEGGEGRFEQHCRKVSADGRSGHCVQLWDRAHVYKVPEGGRRRSSVYHTVAVGCACMLRDQAETTGSLPDPD